MTQVLFFKHAENPKGVCGDGYEPEVVFVFMWTIIITSAIWTIHTTDLTKPAH